MVIFVKFLIESKMDTKGGIFKRITAKASTIWQDLSRRRRLSIHNATDNAEEWYTHISPAGIIAALISFLLLLFIITITFVAYSPILEFLPGYRTEATKSRENIINNIRRLDSMEHVMNNMITYNENIALIMDGKTPVVRDLSTSTDAVQMSKELIMPNHADSALRSQMEGVGIYSLDQSQTTSRRSVRESIEMLTPIEGIITDRYDIKNEKFGVRIAAPASAQVVAVDEGTVVLSMWSPETGYIIEIQHSGNLLSIYKNLSQSLVGRGQRVKRGEVIGANIDSGKSGNDAKLFEFELWKDAKPVDPEGYIVF